MNQRGPIIQILASASWGGGEQFVYDLTRRLLTDGRKVVAVVRPGGTVAERFRQLDIPCHTLPMKGVADAVSAVRLFRLIRRCRPSVIHVHHFKDAFTAAYALELYRLRDVAPPRLVLTRHLVRRGKCGWLYRWLYNHIDHMVFVSERARQEFLSSRPPVDMAKTTVIRNGVPETAAAAEPVPDLRTEYGLPREVPLMLFCGRCVAEKGCDVLLRACARLGQRPFALFFAGAASDPVYEASLRRLVAEGGLQDRVFFLGFVRGASRMMAQADICVAPTVAPEALGLAVAEGMQAGCAVLTTDNGAQPEYVENDVTGLLVPPADEKKLSAALCKLLDDDALRTRLGRAAREKVREAFSYEKFYTDYCNLYDE